MLSDSVSSTVDTSSVLEITPSRNLLVIDDCELMRKVIRRLLKNQFAVTFEAEDQNSAIQATKGLGRGDVIISDLQLSTHGENGLVNPTEGLEIARITKDFRKQNNLLFILMSGTASETILSEIEKELSAGVIDDFFQKPYDTRQLRERIKNHFLSIADKSF